ncbi:L-serine ammonia-lyase [Alteromonas sp. IB21]|uniref:L-serine ammonia-lyase n=1 Tax=Alteromonas sp. IB21 TaxID=2779369 RepID=UPI0018E7DB87|nr:L-serine ammonia-lyase [Alteromonas sp. IB21]MBJ2128424.1 L-serine ammonia-lyase [Alteromonas sp. IB21]|tara:strand:+ start:2504 stop:3877 length:1374 start_codon:yes stop_codon:yes gene_type:complete
MISVFDMFSVGIGPSSSHTVGPMKAGAEFVTELAQDPVKFDAVDSVKVELFGSLGQTGIGHGTGKAVILGLLGELPDEIDVDTIESKLEEIRNSEQLCLNGEKLVRFPSKNAIVFHRRKTLPKHANALTFYAYAQDELVKQQTYYSIGGGFIIKDEDFDATKAHAASLQASVPFPFKTAEELLSLCKTNGLSISSLMLRNESTFRPKHEVKQQLHNIWLVMKACIQRGIESEGILPGGLKVVRRAPGLYRRLQTEHTNDPMQTMDWVNLFALAVNEENAAGGRVVTAPTNGAAGIIPAVLQYVDKFIRPVDEEVASRFLLTAGAIGILYKENASISGAEVGCQGEVGVACSMAAGALAEIMGGTAASVENAAEIGMEHNLGLTCDPVGGLVQVPCIERNAMGAIKAINASRLALRGTGEHKVSLDKVIKTMRDTGNDMKTKYKETARGGLAVNIIEC